MVITDSLFKKQIDKFKPFEHDPDFAVAVSGGADSTCLALLLNSYAMQNNASIVALIVDHGLREESAQEAQTVFNRLQDFGIKAKVLKLNLEKKSSSIQQRARQGRYDALLSYCRQNNILHLFVGHHLDDQQETITMRMKRGKSLVGLAGMPALSYKENVRILRPMLGFSKQDIYKTIVERFNAKWVEDPSNNNDKFERVRIRKSLDKEFLDTSFFKKERKIFEESVISAIQDIDISIDKLGVFRFPKDDFLKIKDKKIKVFILSRVLMALSANKYPPSYSSCLAAINAIKNNTKHTLFSNAIYTLNGFIVIHREFRNLPDAISVKDLHKNDLWDNRFNLNINKEKLREKDGCVIKPLGKEGYNILKKENAFTYADSIGNVDKSFFYTLPYIFNKNNMVILNNQDYISNVEIVLRKCALISHIFS